MFDLYIWYFGLFIIISDYCIIFFEDRLCIIMGYILCVGIYIVF